MNKVINDFYILKRLPGTKSPERIDCVKSTGSYPPFERIAAKSKKGRFFCYLTGVPDTFNERAHQAACMILTNNKSITSIYTPDLASRRGFGDMKGTRDALLFQFNDDFTGVMVLVARGLAAKARDLFKAFEAGQLDDEINAIRAAAREVIGKS